MNKLLLLVLLFSVFVAADAFACSSLPQQLIVTCTYEGELSPEVCEDCGITFGDRRVIGQTVEGKAPSNAYVYENQLHFDAYEFSPRYNNTENIKAILRFMDNSCDEDLTFVADNLEELISEWDPSIWSGNVLTIMPKNFGGEKSYQVTRYEEFEDDLMNCREYYTTEVGDYKSFYLGTKDYCFSSPRFCGVSYHINPAKLFFHNLANSSWGGLLYNLIALGILGLLGFGIFKLVKNKTSRHFAKPHWINVLFAIIPSIFFPFYTATIYGAFEALMTFIGLLILNYFLGSLIKIACEKIGLKKFLYLNKISVPILILVLCVGFIMPYVMTRVRLETTIFSVLFISIILYWYFIICLIIFGIKNKKYKQSEVK